jgi:hypothetical protein
MVFKEAADRRKLAGDACKLCTGTSARPIIIPFLPLAEEKIWTFLQIYSSINRAVCQNIFT